MEKSTTFFKEKSSYQAITHRKKEGAGHSRTFPRQAFRALSFFLSLWTRTPKHRTNSGPRLKEVLWFFGFFMLEGSSS
jgi:hypothetical protein